MSSEIRLARIGSDERRRRILVAATGVFVEMGYAASSMALISDRLGGSKGTIYAYFASKESLFRAVVEQRYQCLRRPAFEDGWHARQDLEAILHNFSRQFINSIYQPIAIEVDRLIQAESSRFPDLAECHIRRGQRVFVEALAAMLGKFASTGQIPYHNLDLTAEQFLGMLRGERYLQVYMGLSRAPEPEEVEGQIRQALLIFLRGIGWLPSKTERQGHRP